LELGNKQLRFFTRFPEGMMSRVAILVLALIATISAPAQEYTIFTIAGGAPPPTPAPALTASIGSPDGVATDTGGNIYFTSVNCVFKVDISGTLTRLAGNARLGYSGDGGPASSAQLNSPQGLAVDGAGNLYIADFGNRRVRKISPNGTITTVAGNGNPGFSGDGGPATSARLADPSGVAVDPAGNLYIADSSNHRVRKVSSDGLITTVAGNGTQGFSGDGGPATSAELNWPLGVATDATGNLYIADYASNRVRKVSPNGTITSVGYVTPFPGGGGGFWSPALSEPWSVAVDSAGNLYIADFGHSRVLKVSSGGSIISAVGSGTIGFSGDGGPAAGAQLKNPAGVALDAAGNLYIADQGNYRVREVSADGIITSIAGNGTKSFSGDGGLAARARLLYPVGMAVDRTGNVYIADTANNRVRRISSNGIIVTVAGGGTAGLGDGGPATSAQLKNPVGVALDAAGNLYIADQVNYRVRKVSASGIIITVAGNGTQGFSGDGGPATSAQLYYPTGVAVDGAGNLYIADSGNNRVRKVSSGVITTVAGGGTGGLADGGTATSAQMDWPVGLAVDAAGNLYISDGQRVRKVSPSGIITVVAGNGTWGFSGDGGPAASAQLNGPQGMALDPAGNLYITEYYNHCVRKVSPSGIITTAAGDGTMGFSGDGGPATSAQLHYPQGLAVDSTGSVYVADTGNSVIRILQPPPAINANGIVNAASYTAAPPAAGGIAALFGTNLAPSILDGGGSSPLKTSAGGASVSVNGVAAPLFYVSPLQVAFQVPWEAAGQSQAAVTVTNNGVTSTPITMSLSAVAPAIFTVNQQGTGQGSVLIANSDVIAAPPGSIPGRTSSPVSRSVYPYISIYCTGLGAVDNAPASGEATSLTTLAPVKNAVTVTIGGVTVPAMFAGLAPGFVGLYQVDAQVPLSVQPGDKVLVTVSAGGHTSNLVTIAVQ